MQVSSPNMKLSHLVSPCRVTDHGHNCRMKRPKEDEDLRSQEPWRNQRTSKPQAKGEDADDSLTGMFYGLNNSPQIVVRLLGSSREGLHPISQPPSWIIVPTEINCHQSYIFTGIHKSLTVRTNPVSRSKSIIHI